MMNRTAKRRLMRTSDGQIYTFPYWDDGATHQSCLNYYYGAAGKADYSLDGGENWDWEYTEDGWKRAQEVTA